MIEKNLAGLISLILFLIYPALIYLGVKYMKPGHLALALFVIVGVRFLAGWVASRKSLKPFIPFVVVGLLSASIVYLTDDNRILLQIPVFVSLALMCVFAYGLFKPPTMIEKFAQMDYPQLPPNATRYCRKVTMVWCLVFFFNAATCFYLANDSSHEAWLAWSAIGMYIFMAAVFGIEYLIRRTKVPEFDRALEEMQQATET